MIFSLALWLAIARSPILQTPKHPILTKIAKDTLDAPKWKDYFWLSDDKVLSWERPNDDVTTADTNTDDQYRRQYMPQVALLNGVVWPLRDFVKIQRQFPSNTSEVTLSQDRKWVLWFNSPSIVLSPTEWVAASLSGLKYAGGIFLTPLAVYRFGDDQQIPHEDFRYVHSPVWRRDGKAG